MKKILSILLLLPLLAFGKTIELNKNNSINFNNAFTDEFVAKKQLEAMDVCFRNVGGDIYITLYTPGGSISAGQLFFDTLNALPCNFHTITVFAASMGYQTVQNLGKRYILPSGVLMSHRASVSGLSGEIGGELNSIIKNLEDNVTELEEVSAKRIGITLEEYREEIRDELWLTAKTAIKKNHADKVVLVTCDRTLKGTYNEIYRTFFGNFRVKFSKCPIIVAPISIESVNYKPATYVERNRVRFLNYFTNIKKRIKLTL